MFDRILLTIFAVSLPICFVRPFFGIVLWTVLAFLNPQSYTEGLAVGFPFALIVAIPTVAGLPFFVKSWTNRLASREVLLLVVLWLWFTITTLISINTPEFMHHAADTWAKWGEVSKIFLMTVVAIAVLEDFRQLRILLLVIAGCFGVFVAKSLPFMIATGGEFRLYGPENSMIADNNDFGLALNMTAPIFFLLAQTETRRWVRRLFGFLFLITIPAVLFTYSRGAVIGLVAVLAMMVFRMKQRFLLIVVIGVGIAVGALFAPESWRQRMDPNADAMDASAQSRINAWTFCWRLASDYPIAGGGFATFTDRLFERYAPNTVDVHNSHSIYFGLLAEHGFVGLGLYGALVLSCFATTRKLIKQARTYNDFDALQYAVMFRIAIIGFLVSGAFLSRAYFDYFFTLVACIAILKRVCTEAWEEVEAGDPELEQVAAGG